MTPAMRTSLRLLRQPQCHCEILQTSYAGSTFFKHGGHRNIPFPNRARLSTMQKPTTGSQQDLENRDARKSHLASHESILSLIETRLGAGDLQGVKTIVRDKLSDIEAEVFQLLEGKRPLMRELKKGLADDSEYERVCDESEAEGKKNAKDIKFLTWSVILLSVANLGNCVAIMRDPIW